MSKHNVRNTEPHGPATYARRFRFRLKRLRVFVVTHPCTNRLNTERSEIFDSNGGQFRARVVYYASRTQRFTFHGHFDRNPKYVSPPTTLSALMK